MPTSIGYPSSEPCAVCGGNDGNEIEPRFGYTVCKEHFSTRPVDIPRTITVGPEIVRPALLNAETSGIHPYAAPRFHYDAVRLSDDDPLKRFLNEEPTVYRDPSAVECPTCGEPAGRPCQRVNVGSGVMNIWHPARERIPS